MHTLQIILTVISFILLLFFSAIKPSVALLSKFELKRRTELGDKEAERVLTREELLNDIISLKRALTALMLVIFVLLSIVTFNWLIGIILAVFVALEYGAIARLGFIRSWSQKLYDRFEKDIIRFVQKAPYLFKIVSSP
ncbi:MAG TPA: hypothetical protein VMR16_00295, partial [Candidatus Saccharimonadales bacterium]|nr:hypothetical protein [Candidatus Saccharimonadales bacterium]